MAFNVQEFRAQLNLDGARPNLFQCSMSPPFNQGGADSKFSFMCKTSQLPGSTVNQVPVNYFGRELKFAGNRTFTEWTVTVINDEDFIIRSSFERWMNALDSHVGNLRADGFLSGDGGYQRDAYVRQYGKQGNVLKLYKFVGMFPIDLSPIDLDWGANDTIEEYAITFAYQWWESQTTDSMGGSVVTPTFVGN